MKTVLEGEFDELMRILKEALEVAGQEADNVFANVKINVGEILSIDKTPRKPNRLMCRLSILFKFLINT